ncbi:hypothetical protein [Flavobacterium silvaticum]|uniref:Uncharacterized protein n=1 Tax=Flavobacterium silvaticum TaxID=1852020 RepID=A0A972FL54_9FLAO|nr:hypothetical protein [Flavobacterium silvaticum]NMH27250.1 hypothetical protein [Flavobacterium silvaticum]
MPPKFTIPGVLPNYTLNWSGRVVSRDGTCSEIKMMPADVAMERTVLMGSLAADGSISGKARRNFMSQEAFSFREAHSTQDNENYLKLFENELNKFRITLLLP